MASSDTWLPVHLYCSNCGQKLTGYKTADGLKVKFQCPRCKVVTMSSKKKGKVNLELEPPKGSVIIGG